MSIRFVLFKQPDTKFRTAVVPDRVSAVLERGDMDGKPRTGIRMSQGCPKPVIVEHGFIEVLDALSEGAYDGN